jgi:zinc-binding in reverse transcriptase
VAQTRLTIKVIFTVVSHGCYTIKIGYQMLKSMTRENQVGTIQFWRILWKQVDVLPRIQLFIWRIVQGGLPVGETWARKLGLNVPVCAICGMDVDDVMHVLFYCQFARAVWLASPLGVQSLSLPSNFIQVFLYFKESLFPTDFKLFLNTLWALWKVGCAHLYEGKPASPLAAIKMATEYSRAGLTLPKRYDVQCHASGVSVSLSSNLVCFLDGSYSEDTGGQGDQL